MMWMCGDIPSLSFGSLGYFPQEDGEYCVFNFDHCLAEIEKLAIDLQNECTKTRPVRRAMHFVNLINRDLIHILSKTSSSKSNEDSDAKIFQSTLRLLVLMTQPIECLTVAPPYQSNEEQHFQNFFLTWLLRQAKEAFVNPKAMRAVLNYLRRIIDNKEPISAEDCEAVSNSLLLIRNVIHAPEDPNYPTNKKILWNLFAQGMDRLVLDLLSSQQKDEWVIPIVQLVALFYKDQHAENIRRQLVLDSNFGASFPAVDSLLASAEENPTGMQHVEKIKNNSSQTTTWKEKRPNVIITYNPSDEDISGLLKKFTIDFLLNGYDTLVGQLHHQLLIRKESLPLDKSHFYWLLTYFLRFVPDLKLDTGKLKNIFNTDLLSYLTHQSIHETEQFHMNSSQLAKANLIPYSRRLHLGVTAIREYLRAIDTYSRLESDTPQSNVTQLHNYLPVVSDLRQLFLLHLRNFDGNIQSRHYLRDIITANHVMLLTVERAAQQSSFSFDLRQNLMQFCSRTIISRYGTALEDFKTNGPFVNDCIMTVLHHVGADLGRIDLLCEPYILRPFCDIWKEGFNVCDDWNDIIEHVTQQFIRNLQLSGPGQSAEQVMGDYREEDTNFHQVSAISVNDSRETFKRRRTNYGANSHIQRRSLLRPVSESLEVFRMDSSDDEKMDIEIAAAPSDESEFAFANKLNSIEPELVLMEEVPLPQDHAQDWNSVLSRMNAQRRFPY